MSATGALLERALREVDQGLLPSCQLAVARGGDIVVFEAFGDATTSTRYTVFSCTKPIVAAAVWVLMGEGEIDAGRPVAEYVPEFAANGKHAVTVEHVLLHTSGFPHAELLPPEWDTSEGRRAAFARWTLAWEPGSTYEYHPASAHWVLAEIVEAVSGEDWLDFLEKRVTRPAGIDRRVLGVAPGDNQGIATLHTCGEPATADEIEEAIGVRDLGDSSVTDATLLALDRPDVRAAGVPGAGAVMTAAELALFYQQLLHDRGRIWDPAVLADATGNVRNRLGDRLFGLPANRTLGLVVAGDDGLAFLRGFGTASSPRTFGHGGAGGQTAWADPESGISFAYLTNGLDSHVIRQGRRRIELSTLAASCS